MMYICTESYKVGHGHDRVYGASAESIMDRNLVPFILLFNSNLVTVVARKEMFFGLLYKLWGTNWRCSNVVAGVTAVDDLVH